MNMMPIYTHVCAVWFGAGVASLFYSYKLDEISERVSKMKQFTKDHIDYLQKVKAHQYILMNWIVMIEEKLKQT